MEDDPETIVDRLLDDGYGGDYEQPLIIEEWTARPVRQTLRDGHVLTRFVEHLAEYDLEEAGDDDGTLYERMLARADNHAVQLEFAAFLDLLFEGVNWLAADKLVATIEVRWEVPDAPDAVIDPDDVTYTRIETP